MLGARAIAPEELLRSRGAAGDPIGDADVLRELIDRISRGIIDRNDLLSGGETDPLEELIGPGIPDADPPAPRFTPVDDTTGTVPLADDVRRIPIDPAPFDSGESVFVIVSAGLTGGGP